MKTINLEEYTAAAIKTESRIDGIKSNLNILSSTLKICMAIGNILDMQKKNIFYDKPIDINKFKELNDQISKISINLNSEIEKIDNIENLPKPQINTINPRVAHGIIGKFTEATELIEAMYQAMFEGKNLDSVNVAEEIGDDAWYTAILVDALNINWTGIFEKNIEKLKKRYNDKFSVEKAINRDLEAEREILEKNHD